MCADVQCEFLGSEPCACARVLFGCRRIDRGDFIGLVSRTIFALGFLRCRVKLGLLMIKGGPGVKPKPRFGPIMDSSVNRL